MKWRFWIAGAVLLFITFVIYCCAVAAGRAERELEKDLMEYDPDGDEWDAALLEDEDV